MDQILQYWKEIIGFAAMVGGYFVGVKKDKADIFSTMQSSYKVFIDDMNLKYVFMSNEVKTMSAKIDVFETNEQSLRTVIQTLEIKITKMQKENELLKIRLTKYEKS